MNGVKIDPSVIKDDLIKKYPELQSCSEQIELAFQMMRRCFLEGHKLLIAGNGGSAADSEHISGELMKSFRFHRKASGEVLEALSSKFGSEGRKVGDDLEGALPALPIVSFSSISTAFSNDANSEATFAQLIYGYGMPGDVLLAVTTSGESENIYRAIMVAQAKGMTVICLTGQSDSRCAGLSDLAIQVPARETYLVQELHLPIYHALCAMLEAELFEQGA